MPLTPHIFICGNEELLLDTRRLVLERARFEVKVAKSVTAALTCLNEQKPALLILCHTLTRQQRETLMAAAAEQQPPVRTLSFCTERNGDGVTGDYIHNFAGAQGLIEAAQRMLP